MGTLGGHVLPGSFFILFALWWSFITAIRYVQSKMKSPFKKSAQLGYRSSITMPCICLPCGRLKRAPIESFIKFFFAAVGLAGEIITGVKYEDVSYKLLGTMAQANPGNMGHDHAMGHVHNHSISERSLDGPRPPHSYIRLIESNQQHSTMYSAFIFGAIVEMLIHYKFDVPKHLDYAFGIMGFSVECFLFAFHLHGRDLLDVHLHTLLVYAIMGCVVFSCLEMWKPTQVLFTYGRITFTMFQGTWFFQVGFVLYPPTNDPVAHWDLNNHDNVMLITMVYCWHLMLIMMGLLVELWVIKLIYKYSKPLAQQWDELIIIDDNNRSYITTDANGNEAKFLSLNSEDEDSADEKIEFDGREKIKLNQYNDKNKSSSSSTTSGNYSAHSDKHIV